MKKGFLDGYKTYDTSGGFGNPKKWKKALYEKMSRGDAESVLNTLPETPYTILGITSEASEADIKKAFRKLIVVWHPDKNPDKLEEAAAMSKKIIAAYTVLTS